MKQLTIGFFRGSPTAAVLLLGVSAHASIIPPVGLAPGAQFRLIFVSSQTRAVDPVLSTLDTFITGLADATGLGSYNGGSVAWHVLGSNSTPGTDAFDRLPDSSVPIYTTNGDLVANAANDIWSGTLLHAIDFTETGAILNTLVWTATMPNGRVSSDNQGFGDFGDLVAGNSAAANSGWIDFTKVFSQFPSHSYYGYSDAITSATPEPSTGTLLFAAIAILYLVCGFRRASARATCGHLPECRHECRHSRLERPLHGVERAKQLGG